MMFFLFLQICKMCFFSTLEKTYLFLYSIYKNSCSVRALFISAKRNTKKFSFIVFLSFFKILIVSISRNITQIINSVISSYIVNVINMLIRKSTKVIKPSKSMSVIKFAHNSNSYISIFRNRTRWNLFNFVIIQFSIKQTRIFVIKQSLFQLFNSKISHVRKLRKSCISNDYNIKLYQSRIANV